MLVELFKKAYADIHEKIYSYRTIRLEPSEWVEQSVYMPREVTPFPGWLKYDISPYTKEIIDCMGSNSDVETLAVMKCNQSGFTGTVVVPSICYFIGEKPSNMLFLSGTDDLARNTVRDKLDPVLQASGLNEIITASDTKKRNQRSGNTDFKKEFPGGTLNVGSYKPSNLRMHTVRVVVADEFDNAPYSDSKEGSTRTLLENRTTAYGSTKKLLYISTPTVKGASNIEDVYNDGDKREWNWLCPHCDNYIPIKWSVEREDGSHGGIKWEKLKTVGYDKDSIHYECQICRGKILEEQKYNLNLTGKWIPTCEAEDPHTRSYLLNALVLPPSFDSWVSLVKRWVRACPTNEPVDEGKLRAFINTKLGQTWEEKGVSPKANQLQQNMKSYDIGVIPDRICEEMGNGCIVLVTLSCDLGGVMELHNEDVRIDWEIVAHTSSGVEYRIDHGSIGSFKRGRTKSKKEKENESERDRLTYAHGQPNSVWPHLKSIIEATLQGETGRGYDIDITVIDTGNFTKLAYDFIREVNNPFVVGVRGYFDGEHRNINKDTPIIKRSQELLGKLYILQVNQIKDILATNMALRENDYDKYQPPGFMNFPQPEGGKYTYPRYFIHYEAEHRVEEKKGDVVIGYAWKKKNSSVENHFFDVAVYTIAAREIYIDILRRSHTQNAKLTWEIFVEMMLENNNNT